MMPQVEQFLGLLRRRQLSELVFKLGTIPSDYASGQPTIIFDGEATASVRTYPYLSSYTPAANDRVLLAMVGHSGVVLGEVT